MLVAEMQELDEVKGLVVKGQQDGVISYGEVATAVSEVDLDESDIEELYAYLERQGVELVDSDGNPDKELQRTIRHVCLDSGLVILSCGTADPHGGRYRAGRS